MPVGFATRTKMQALSNNTKQAIQICDTCPIKTQCLEEGMKEENISYGVWGGLMAGERLMSTGKTKDDYTKTTEQWKALYFLERVKEYI
jgi:hypothetical protein